MVNHDQHLPFGNIPFDLGRSPGDTPEQSSQAQPKAVKQHWLNICKERLTENPASLMSLDITGVVRSTKRIGDSHQHCRVSG